MGNESVWCEVVTEEAVMILPAIVECERVNSLNKKILLLSPEMPFWHAEQSGEVSQGVLGLVLQVPDKADYRTYAAQALVTLLDKFPCAEFAKFIAWLYKYSLSKVSESPWCFGDERFHLSTE